MRDWLAALASDRALEIAVAVALGYALVTLAEHVVSVPISVLAQHLGRGVTGLDAFGLLDLRTSPLYLNFNIGSTYIAYGPILASLVVLGLVALTAWYVVRRRDRALGECPFCASRIPFESTHCAFCGSGVEPGEP
jgi:hypothetical protein